MMQQFIIGMHVANQFGVLARVSSLFSRRGFNIDALTVGTTEDPAWSRITVTMTGDEYTQEQIVKQLSKLQAVKEIKIMDPKHSVSRELLMIKVAAAGHNRQEVMDAANVFRAKIIDFSSESLCMEITGDSNKLDAFIALLQPFGIIEMCRTGNVALDRGHDRLKSE